MRLSKYKVVRPLLLCLCFILGYYFLLSHITGLDTLRLKSADFLYRLKHKIKAPGLDSKAMVIVAVDSLSLKFLEQTFPLKRDIYATLLNALRDKDPQTIAFDISFPNRNKDDFESDLLFSLSLKNSNNVILPSFFDPQNREVFPHSLFQTPNVSIGHLNKPRDHDFTVRMSKPLLFYRAEDFITVEKSYSLEIEVMKDYYEIADQDIGFQEGKALILQEASSRIIIPLERDNNMRINYMATTLDFKIIPLARILKGIVPKDIFYKKIILIGVIEDIFHDMYPTPLGILPGIIINANSILTILSQQFVRLLPPFLNLLILLLLTAGTVFIIMEVTIFIGFLIIITEIALCSAASFFLFWRYNIIWEPVHFVFSLSGIFMLLSIYKYIMLKIEKMYFEKLAITDGLTGLYIHRYLMLRLTDKFEMSQRHKQPFSFLIMDIDHFKLFNDTYGHEIGNEVLQLFAKVMRENFRKVDFLARYGGEEFCAILPMIEAEGAFESAERFRRTLSQTQIPHLKEVKVTVSIGIASVPAMDDIKNVEDIIKCADKALYVSKKSGRNRTTIYSSSMR